MFRYRVNRINLGPLKSLSDLSLQKEQAQSDVCFGIVYFLMKHIIRHVFNGRATRSLCSIIAQSMAMRPQILKLFKFGVALGDQLTIFIEPAFTIELSGIGTL